MGKPRMTDTQIFARKRRLFATLAGAFIVLAPLAMTGETAMAQAPAAALASDIIIYHAEGRRSERIVWLCEELGLPYELRFRPGDVAGSYVDIRAANPSMAVAPTVIYRGQLLMESGAIIQIILDNQGAGRLVPAITSPDYAHHMMFMHFAEGTLAADIIADYRTARATDGLMPRTRETDGQRSLRYADEFLAKHPYFGGEQFTAADIMMLFPTGYGFRQNVADPAKYPHVVAWQAKVEARPAFQRMLAKARPNGRLAPLVRLK